jgi:hypothetical protein
MIHARTQRMSAGSDGLCCQSAWGFDADRQGVTLLSPWFGGPMMRPEGSLFKSVSQRGRGRRERRGDCALIPPLGIDCTSTSSVVGLWVLNPLSAGAERFAPDDACTQIDRSRREAGLANPN